MRSDFDGFESDNCHSRRNMNYDAHTGPTAAKPEGAGGLVTKKLEMCYQRWSDTDIE